MRLDKISSSPLEPLNITLGSATHVVCGIEWGFQTILSFSKTLPEDSSINQARKEFVSTVNTLRSQIEQLEVSKNDTVDVSQKIAAYSDICNDKVYPSGDFDIAHTRQASCLICAIPRLCQQMNRGKGEATTYLLLPIETLSLITSVSIPSQVQDAALNLYYTRCIRKQEEFVAAFDQLDNAHTGMIELQLLTSENTAYLITTESEGLVLKLEGIRNLRNDPVRRFTARTQQGQNSIMFDILQSYSDWYKKLEEENPLPSKKIVFKRINFIQGLLTKGAIYVGNKSQNWQAHLGDEPQSEYYTLSFSKETLENDILLQKTMDLAQELLAKGKPSYILFLVDSDACSLELDRIKISCFKNGETTISDMIEHRTFLSGKSFAQYSQGGLQPSDPENPLQLPVKRRSVKIACPYILCHSSKICEWYCPKYLQAIEYGFSDQYFYCGCGRCMYDEYTFKCNNMTHGTEFTENSASQGLLALLGALSIGDNLNILILGETGVGKSTFINALVNYLAFESLEESKKAKGLQSVIPCSSTAQMVDETNLNGEYQQFDIKVGQRDDENNGNTGESATQQTMVYPVTIGNTTYRLIETPGMGDTRGLDFDKKNMADMLNTLRTYDEIHGILILLKSNNTRLTTAFRYCIKELLTHLHNNAAHNIAFGFTNSRGTNYTPGESLGLMKEVLQDFQHTELRLTRDTMYCFDSESFRYLAAFKQGIFMNNENWFQGSWKISREETVRLIEYYKTLTPHKVQSTISLNGVRDLILQLTKPMANMAQII